MPGVNSPAWQKKRELTMRDNENCPPKCPDSYTGAVAHTQMIIN